MEVYSVKPIIYKAKLFFEEDGTILKSFTIVEKRKGSAVKKTYDVSVAFHVDNANTECVLTFDPENGKITIDGDGKEIRIVDGTVKLKEEKVETNKKTRKRA